MSSVQSSSSSSSQEHRHHYHQPYQPRAPVRKTITISVLFAFKEIQILIHLELTCSWHVFDTFLLYIIVPKPTEPLWTNSKLKVT